MASKGKKLGAAAGIFDQNLDGTIRKIPLDEIIPTSTQPRKNTDVNINALSKSLIEEGLLQPIIVSKKNNKFYIIAGERRFRAATLAGWSEIECRILNKSPKDTFRLAVIENLQREDLNPLEEAVAYKRLKDEYDHTDNELSEIIGKSRNYISEILSIAEIPKSIMKEANKIGIRNKNMLIQLSQAFKNNAVEEFLSNFKNGIIKTVKDAKGFIHKEKETKAVAQLNDNKKIKPRDPGFKLIINKNNTNEIELKIQLFGIVANHPEYKKVIKSTLENSLTQLLRALRG